MPDSKYDGQVVGAYIAASAPTFQAGQFSSYGDLSKAVEDLIYTRAPGGLEADLASNTTGEAWYVLGTAIEDATKRLGEINTQFAGELKAMKDHLTGEAGDAFNKLGKDLLDKSEEVFSALDGKAYGRTVGNIGHAVQAYASAWWDLVQKYDDHRASEEDRIKDAANLGILNLSQIKDLVEHPPDLQDLIDKLADKTADEISKLDAKVKEDLLRDLKNLTTGLANQYNARGEDLVPLHIIGEKPKASAPPPAAKPADSGKDKGDSDKDKGDSGKDDTGKDKGDSGKSDSGDTDKDDTDKDDSSNDTERRVVPTESGGAEKAGGSGDSERRAEPQKEKLQPAPDTQQKASEAAAKAGQQATDAINSMGGTAPDTGTGTGAGSGTEAAAPGGTAPTDGGVTPATGLASRVPVGEKAQEAADNAKKAIDGIAGNFSDPEAEGAPSGGGGAAAPGGSLATPEAQKALSDAHDATGKALDDMIGKTGDPAAKEALQHAKDAANQAIEGLSDQAGGAGTPSTTSDGPGRGQDEKVALDRQPALDDGQKQQVHEAQSAVDKTMDDMIGKTDDPSRHNALEMAKSAAHEALTNLVDPAQALASRDELLPMAAQDFLNPDGAAGQDTFPAHSAPDLDKLGALTTGTAGGSGGGSIAGLDGLTATETGGGGPGGGTDVATRFDTDTASGQRGASALGVQTPAQPFIGASPAVAGAQNSMGSGMPMGGMGSGMGGMGEQNKEREPQVWLQAGNSAWDDESDAPPSPVLGRS
jgi:hypothetical protein